MRRVWLTGWEHACCGESFAVGSTVEWRLCTMDGSTHAFFSGVLGERVADAITDTEEPHGVRVHDGIDAPVVQGVVRAIERVGWRLPEGANESEPPYSVPGSVVIEPAATAPLFEADVTHQGWLVDLDVTVPDNEHA